MSIVGSTLYLLEIRDGIVNVMNKEELNDDNTHLEIAAFERGKIFKRNQQVWILD
jgi:hypothetical protein